MCIRDSRQTLPAPHHWRGARLWTRRHSATDSTLIHDGDHCLLYTSDAADERSSVDLGGRRIIKKKNIKHNAQHLEILDIKAYI